MDTKLLARIGAVVFVGLAIATTIVQLREEPAPVRQADRRIWVHADTDNLKQGRFVLAVPRRRGVPPVVRRSASPDDVCDDNASFWTSDDTPEASLGTHGFLIGCVFSAQTARTVDAVPLPESESAQATAMRLVRNYWGAYVAILPDPGRRTLALLVDPSGLFPVYRGMSQTHVVFSSDACLVGEAVGDRLRTLGGVDH